MAGFSRWISSMKRTSCSSRIGKQRQQDRQLEQITGRCRAKSDAEFLRYGFAPARFWL